MVKRYKSTMLEMELHQRIKELAVKKGKTINNLVREFTEREIENKYLTPPEVNKPIQPICKKNLNKWWKV